jgi:hypothetical protein
MGRLAPISQFSATSGILLLFTGEFAWFIGPHAVAQESRGTIVGQILDSTGAIVPGTTVTATNVATNVKMETKSNSTGQYIFPFLIPGGGSNLLDLSFLKKTRVRERHEIEFRADFFNLFNHPTEATDPNTRPTSSAFGQMSQFGALPRNIQLGIKCVF